MRVPVEKANSWSAGLPSLFLNGPFFDGAGSAALANYDISPDGQRFLMIKSGIGPEQTAAPPTLVLIQNWFEELKKRVPVR